MASYQLVSCLILLATLFAYLNDRFLRWPPTIGIMALSLGSSFCLIVFGRFLPIPVLQVKSMLHSVDFELVLMHIMLGFLLFAGAIQLDFGRLRANALPVLVLSIFGTLLSSVLVAGMVWLLFLLFHCDIPFMHCLLFGTVISPTDPVAVMSILKNSGLPEALEIKITGESLFNDGVAVVLFITVSEQIAGGGASPSIAGFGLLFAQEALGGVIFGLVLATAGQLALKSVDNYRLEVLITLSMVMGGYALAEFLHISGPLAMVICGLGLGSRKASEIFSLVSRDYLEKFWHLLDELLNSILFMLIGFELLVVEIQTRFVLIALVLIFCVLAARLVSVWLPITVMKKWFRFERHTVTLMTWGGLRGGLSVAMALSIPEVAHRGAFVLLTYVLVVFSILVQGLSIGPLCRYLLAREPRPA